MNNNNKKTLSGDLSSILPSAVWRLTQNLFYIFFLNPDKRVLTFSALWAYSADEKIDPVFLLFPRQPGLIFLAN